MSTFKQTFNKFLPEVQKNHSLNFQQTKAAQDILACKTKDLGGHVQKCDDCENILVHYNSCRNRHCPICQAIDREIWVDKRRPEVLDAPYFHVVFTVPQELHSLIYKNQGFLYGLMYKAVAETLTELCADKKYLGAQTGFISVLHTWSQDLHYQPHIHTMLLGGGLTQTGRWRRCSKGFFIPVRVLSKKLRGKFLYYLKSYYRQDKLKGYGDENSSEAFQDLIDRCYDKNWYVYAKETFNNPLKVLKYLGNYTQRIAISESRIVSVNEETVTFNVKNRKNGQKKTVTLKGNEFVRRFLMHVLPKGFVKVRHYGLLANRNKKEKIKICRRLTGSIYYAPLFEGLTKMEIVSLVLGKDLTICPSCKTGKLKAYDLYSGLWP